MSLKVQSLLVKVDMKALPRDMEKKDIKTDTDSELVSQQT